MQIASSIITSSRYCEPKFLRSAYTQSARCLFVFNEPKFLRSAYTQLNGRCLLVFINGPNSLDLHTHKMQGACLCSMAQIP